MKKLTFLLISFFSLNVYCQKNIEDPENEIAQRFYENLDSLNSKYDLKDLRKSNDVAIRIWKGNEIILLHENSKYLIHTTNGEKRIVKKKKINNKSNLDSIFKVINTNAGSYSKNDPRYIDAFPTTIELNNAKNYKIISFYKNDNLQEIIRNIRKENLIDELKKEIIINLPAGNYIMGMASIRVDHLPEEEKSDFYRKLKPEIAEKLEITEKTDPLKMPLILINRKPRYFEDLNKLSLSDVRSYEIIEDDKKLLYGTSGRFGVISVTTN